MDQVTFLSIGTVLAFIAFMSVCIWVYFARKKTDFDEAAQLPFADELEADAILEQALSNDKVNNNAKHIDQQDSNSFDKPSRSNIEEPVKENNL